MNENLNVVISSPVDTYSGYGSRGRDFIKALIDMHPTWNVQLLSQRWGDTRFGYLEDHKEFDLQSRIIPTLTSRPDVWIQITVPNEFQKVGKYNIGVTAGIETTLAAAPWIEGCNRMDLVLVSSEHSKSIFKESKFNVVDKNTNNVQRKISLETPIEVIFEGIDLSKYYKKDTSTFDLSEIKEEFCFLTFGHWLQGEFGHDRKNIGYTIKSFLETFKNKSNPPALLLKTQQSSSSILDRENLLNKIDRIRKTVKGKLPNIYLLHGEITDSEVNELYNHPKVKALVSHTRGEGFGRPLLEFSITSKPIIASNWSGQIDFLDKKFCYMLGGSLEKLDKSSTVKNMLLEDSMWFKPDDKEVTDAYISMYKNYKKYLVGAKRQAYKTRSEFSFEKMAISLKNILENNMPIIPIEKEIKLPELPKLKKK